MAEIEFADHEKEPEMQIGLPTDVKHVAHIGQDGPSAANTAPTWMNEFKAQAGEEDPVNCVPQDVHIVSRKGSKGKNSSSRDKPELPKSSKSTTTDKAKQSKKTRKSKDPNQDTESTSKDTKKTGKRKKLKDSSGEGSSRRHRDIQDLDTVSESGSQFSCGSDL